MKAASSGWLSQQSDQSKVPSFHVCLGLGKALVFQCITQLTQFLLPPVSVSDFMSQSQWQEAEKQSRTLQLELEKVKGELKARSLEGEVSAVGILSEC